MAYDPKDKSRELVKQVINREVALPIKTEVNFMQYPLGNVYGRSKNLTVTYKRSIRDNGIEKKIIWKAMGTGEYGLPGPGAIETDLAITKLINDRGWPVVRYLQTSLYEIAKTKNINPNGDNIRLIKRDLLELATTSYESQFTYKQVWEKDKRKKYLSGGDAVFHKYDAIILRKEPLPGSIPKSELTPEERKTGISDHVYIVLGEIYLNSLNSYYLKKIDYNYLMNLPDVVLKRIYLILNLAFATVMNENGYVCFPYTDFCQRIPIETRRYISDAKRKIQKHLDALKHDGYIQCYDWNDNNSSNPDDWELILYPGTRANYELDQSKNQEQFDFGISGTNTRGVDEVLTYFFALYELKRDTPTDKERDQALELLKRTGDIDKVKRIIYYSKLEAARTGFNIKFFGAVLSYENDALAYIREENTKHSCEVNNKEKTGKEDQIKLEEDKHYSKLLEIFYRLPEDEQKSIRQKAVVNAKQRNPLYAKSIIGINNEIVNIIKGMLN
ncbi:MAG: hypothetical protein WC955_03945 [Elusimicrobiota bacterium]